MRCSWALGIGHWALGIGHWALGIGRVPYFPENRYSFFSDRTVSHINSGSKAGMISNPRFLVGRKVESRGQQIIRAIIIFVTHSQQSTVNSQQSYVY